MKWTDLLTTARSSNGSAARRDGRSAYHVDLDRIVFSQPFRRLQDKTQVHPRSPNDHVRRRLTHSIEVASIGRSLGTLVAPEIINRHGLTNNPSDFAFVMQAACHAHDIGNPPFGHLGEDAIRDWFQRNHDKLQEQGIGIGRKSELWRDLENFEGNAQGFRIVVKTENHKGRSGLDLTYATLGAFMKYPNPAGKHPGGKKKFGFYQSERKEAGAMESKLCLGTHASGCGWRRHPLAFLLEAADDISYAIVDLEDGIELDILSLDDVVSLLRPLIPESSDFWKIGKRKDKTRARREAMRGDAIGTLIEEAAHTFLHNEAKILRGTFTTSSNVDCELMDFIEHSSTFETAKTTAKRRVFSHPSKSTKEFSAFRILGSLLDAFTLPVSEWANNRRKDGGSLSRRAEQIVAIMGNSAYGLKELSEGDPDSQYEALMRVVDYVGGMTDGYATGLYRHLEGIAG